MISLDTYQCASQRWMWTVRSRFKIYLVQFCMDIRILVIKNPNHTAISHYLWLSESHYWLDNGVHLHHYRPPTKSDHCLTCWPPDAGPLLSWEIRPLFQPTWTPWTPSQAPTPVQGLLVPILAIPSPETYSELFIWTSPSRDPRPRERLESRWLVFAWN